MPIDESKYRTLKLMRCKKCGNVYAASLTSAAECPECSSRDASYFRPDGKEQSDKSVEE
jgi:predicted Zn-ribbon and HTH transcriptional regulator